MKRLLTVLCLCALVAVVGAESLTGFWGIRFGSFIDQVEPAFAAKGAKGIARHGDGVGDYLFSNGVTFAGRKGDITLYFFKSQFYMAFVKYSFDRYDLFDGYKALKKDLTDKYGTPVIDLEEYKYPYKKGDGDEIMAVRMNAASIYSVWEFENKNAILLTARYDKESDEYRVLLSYRDWILYDQNQKANNPADDL